MASDFSLITRLQAVLSAIKIIDSLSGDEIDAGKP